MNKETEALIREIGAAANSNGDGELEALRREKKLRENVAREVEEFYKLFPDTDLESVPDEVWEACPEGVGLCAQYALYLHRRAGEKKHAEAKNEENSTSAVPDVSSVEDKEVFFTPEEVASMSRAEVDKNYEAIMESMKKWK